MGDRPHGRWALLVPAFGYRLGSVTKHAGEDDLARAPAEIALVNAASELAVHGSEAFAVQCRNFLDWVVSLAVRATLPGTEILLLFSAGLQHPRAL